MKFGHVKISLKYVNETFRLKLTQYYNVFYCIYTFRLHIASCSAHQSEALPVRETQREESMLTPCR